MVINKRDESNTIQGGDPENNHMLNRKQFKEWLMRAGMGYDTDSQARTRISYLVKKKIVKFPMSQADLEKYRETYQETPKRDRRPNAEPTWHRPKAVKKK